MGLFGWLFGKPQRVAVRDMIWLTAAARLRGAAGEVTDSLAAGRPVLLVAHFPTTLAAFGEHLVGPDRPRVAIPNGLTPAAALKLAGEAGPRVLFGLARNLRPDEFPPPDDAAESPLPVVVLERHFLREHDDHVVRFAEGLGGKAAVTFHPSLDDPLMRLFAGEWVQTMLRRLGMEEHEAIDSGMVAGRIKKAQGKFAAEVRNERDADSPEEWLRLNHGSG